MVGGIVDMLFETDPPADVDSDPESKETDSDVSLYPLLETIAT
jgi:hypothetical protein